MFEPQQPVALTIGTGPGATCPSSLDLTESAERCTDPTTSFQQRPPPPAQCGLPRPRIGVPGRPAQFSAEPTRSNSDIAPAAGPRRFADRARCPVARAGRRLRGARHIRRLGRGRGLCRSATWSPLVTPARPLLAAGRGVCAPHGADGSTVTLRCYPAIEATQWDGAEWDVGTWSSRRAADLCKGGMTWRTNPNRPEYMDTIESTWGQSVADHVIRPTAAPKPSATRPGRGADPGRP